MRKNSATNNNKTTISFLPLFAVHRPFWQISTPYNDSYHEAAEGKLNNTTPCETIFTADYISVLEIAASAYSMQQPLNLTTRRWITTEANRDASIKRLLRNGWMDKSRVIVCETRAALFSYKHLFPAKTVFSVLRFLTRLLRRLEFRNIIKDSEGKKRRKRLVLRD